MPELQNTTLSGHRCPLVMVKIDMQILLANFPVLCAAGMEIKAEVLLKWWGKTSTFRYAVNHTSWYSQCVLTPAMHPAVLKGNVCAVKWCVLDILLFLRKLRPAGRSCQPVQETSAEISEFISATKNRKDFFFFDWKLHVLRVTHGSVALATSSENEVTKEYFFLLFEAN